MVVSRRASIDFLDPGGPRKSTLCSEHQEPLLDGWNTVGNTVAGLH
jgi:hypothetical protein